jgi:hypothetical protein
MESDSIAVTVLKPVSEVERLWRDSDYRPTGYELDDERVSFRAAPGDRGTEVHVNINAKLPVPLDGVVQKLKRTSSRARALDELRQFKQLVETGVIARSEAVPEGEQVGRKLHLREAQPLEGDELQKAGV